MSDGLQDKEFAIYNSKYDRFLIQIKSSQVIFIICHFVVVTRYFKQ